MPSTPTRKAVGLTAVSLSLASGASLQGAAVPALGGLTSRSGVPRTSIVTGTLPLVRLAPQRLARFAARDGDVWAHTIPCDSDSDGCIALCDLESCSVVAPVGLAQRAKVAGYFGLWFALSIGYSITNKKVTNVLPLPWSVATATVIVGSLFVQALWMTGLRKPPSRSSVPLRALIPIGTFHAIGHIAGTVGTAAGSVSFAQVVKAAGPVYACILSTVVLRQAVSWRVWASLLPIMCGVGLATMKELSFCWAALLGAVVSDLALALRNVLSKQSMSSIDPDAEKMSPANMFGVLTIISAAVSIPMALAVEGAAFPRAWQAAIAMVPGGAATLAAQIALTGLYFYAYSEVAMKALNNVSPVTHAIGNTMRRVVIMLVCMVVFHTPMTPLGAVGSALAVAGSYIYAMTKLAEKEAEKAKEKEAELAAQLLAEKAQRVLPLQIPNVFDAMKHEGQ